MKIIGKTPEGKISYLLENESFDCRGYNGDKYHHDRPDILPDAEATYIPFLRDQISLSEFIAKFFKDTSCKIMILYQWKFAYYNAWRTIGVDEDPEDNLEFISEGPCQESWLIKRKDYELGFTMNCSGIILRCPPEYTNNSTFYFEGSS